MVKTRARENIKFRPLDDGDDSTDSETEAGYVSKGDTRHVDPQPRLPGAGSAATTRCSTPTVWEEGMHSHVDGGKNSHQATSPARLSTGPEAPDLPDYSDHEVDITSDTKRARHDPEWTPRFLQNRVQLPRPQPNDLPITLPLNQDLSGTGRRGSPHKNPRDPSERHDTPRWQAFWRDVEEKTRHKEAS